MSAGTAIDEGIKAIETGIGNRTKIKVVGVGGGGSNAVDNMIAQDIRDVDFIALNTDAHALVKSTAPLRLCVGEKLTRGLGVGGDHNLGKMAAEESRDEITKAIQGSDMLFITAGMGGGTGTGAAPIVAEIARELGILTIAIVTRPFSFEGAQRTKVAEEGIALLREKVDTIAVIPNDRLLSLDDVNISIEAAFKLVDDVLRQSIQGIYEVIMTVGHINLDFNDVKTVMKGAGPAWIAIGRGSGATRAVDAAKSAIFNPIFDFSIEKAKRILFNIRGNDLKLAEVSDAANIIKQVADPEAQIIFGLGSDPMLDQVMKITLIAADYTEAKKKQVVHTDEVFELAADGRRYSFFSRLK